MNIVFILFIIMLCLIGLTKIISHIKKAWARSLLKQGLLESVEGEKCSSQCPCLFEILDIGIEDYCRYYECHKLRQLKTNACVLGIKKFKDVA